MEAYMCFAVGALFAAATFMMLRRSMVKIVAGFILLGHGANLLLFVSGRLVRGTAPIVPDGELALSGSYADPVPQALILTAIVIGFGLQAFALILIRRVSEETHSDDAVLAEGADREESAQA